MELSFDTSTGGTVWTGSVRSIGWENVMWSIFMEGVLDSGLQGVLIGAGVALVGSFFAT